MKYTLKELRARTNMSQAQLAVQLGVNPATYNAWETMRAEDVKKIAEFYNIKPQDIAIPRSE